MAKNEMDLEGESPSPNTIDVQGFMGSFEVPNQDILVKYISTYAGKRDPDSGHNRLLKELKPMREKIDAKELKDLSSLLQRDLNDSRVATELVPYLLGQKSEVAFFPAILAVLLPSGFIQGDGGEYPTEENGEYGDYWAVSRYRLEGKQTPFTNLTIYPSRTDILVLDGQHRTSAFRYIAGNLKDTEDEIYSAFYQGVDVPEEFNADLPVTVIWFESDEEVNPKSVSRNLFVDVNNSAREVSRARNILLDDREVPSLLTRFTYSKIAEEASYKPNKMSLLHTAFDIDSEIVSNVGHKITLTNPEYIYDVYSWFMLGTTTYDEYDRYRVKRSDRRNRKFLDILGETFNEEIKPSNFTQMGGDEENPKIVLKNSDKIPDFRREHNLKIDPIVQDFFNKFCVTKKHFEATKELEKEIYKKGSATKEEIWEDVFTGGEGLYYTFKYGKADSPKIETYRDEIDEIEDKFEKKRAQIFEQTKKRVSQAFTAIRTKAFQVGVFMGLRIYKKRLNFEEYRDCYEEFIDNVNEIGHESWVFILNEMRSEILGSADPKKWPSYRNIVLRIAMKDTEEPFYNKDNFKYSPEAFIVKNNVWQKVKDWASAEGFLIEDLTYSDIGTNDLNNWIDAEYESVEEIYKNCSLNLIDGDYQSVSTEYVKEKID
jgi:hypothetical protein